LKSYFLLENFFEKYNYINKNRKNTVQSKNGYEGAKLKEAVDKMFNKSIMPKKISTQEMIAQIADEKLAGLQRKKRRKQTLEAENKNNKLIGRLKVREKFITLVKRKEEEDEEKKEEEKFYLKSGFSLQEINDIQPDKIRSMISLDNEDEIERMKIDLMYSNSMKKRMKPKTKKDEGCLTLCSERTKACKCLIF